MTSSIHELFSSETEACLDHRCQQLVFLLDFFTISSKCRHSGTSMKACVCLSIYLSVCLSVRLYVCVCVCQLVTCIPTRTLPRAMTLGAASNQEVEQIEKATDEDDDAAAAARRGQILWVRGLNRLQHQVMTITCPAALIRSHTHLLIHYRDSFLELNDAEAEWI